MRTLVLSMTLLGILVPNLDCRADESDPVGLAADVGISSAYYFRGFNVFQKDEQMDQHFLLAPSLTYSLPGTSLQVGYWGAFQLTGDNASVKVDGGAGAEQDLWVGYSYSLSETLLLAGTLTAYYYPLAKKEVAGTDNAFYLEPQAALTWSNVVDLSLRLAYMHGAQEALKFGRYVYVSPMAAKNLLLNDLLTLSFAATVGYKAFIEDGIKDNVWDAGLSVALPISLPHGMYVKPSLSLVWTNFESKEIADELGACGSVNVGIAL